VKKMSILRLPVVSASAEYLVMGHLMRRNILTYKAPPGNEGYDLICIHPDPRHKRRKGQKAQVRIQVKSRYATDCGPGFPLKLESLDAFDFLIGVFLNIGKFQGKDGGLTGAQEPAFFTFTPKFLRRHHQVSGGWQKVTLRGLGRRIERYRNENGFELIAKKLGVERPRKLRK